MFGAIAQLAYDLKIGIAKDLYVEFFCLVLLWSSDQVIFVLRVVSYCDPFTQVICTHYQEESVFDSFWLYAAR